MKILTEEQHKKYVHLCGLTGEELEKRRGICSKCKKRAECIVDHTVIGLDAEQRLILEKELERLVSAESD